MSKPPQNRQRLLLYSKSRVYERKTRNTPHSLRKQAHDQLLFERLNNISHHSKVDYFDSFLTTHPFSENYKARVVRHPDQKSNYFDYVSSTHLTTQPKTSRHLLHSSKHLQLRHTNNTTLVSSSDDTPISCPLSIQRRHNGRKRYILFWSGRAFVRLQTCPIPSIQPELVDAV